MKLTTAELVLLRTATYKQGTQIDIAKRVGLERSTIGNILSGTRDTTPKTLKKLVKALGLEGNAIGEPPRPPEAIKPKTIKIEEIAAFKIKDLLTKTRQMLDGPSLSIPWLPIKVNIKELCKLFDKHFPLNKE